MALQKYRVICPYCESVLLVTEDLLGHPGTCPGCQQEFQLPGVESFSPGDAVPPASVQMGAASPQRPVSPPIPSVPVPGPIPVPNFAPEQASTGGMSPPNPFSPRVAPRHSSSLMPVRIEGRQALRLLSGLMKIMAGMQVAAGCLILIGLVVLSSSSPMPSTVVLSIVGMALFIGGGCHSTAGVLGIDPGFHRPGRDAAASGEPRAGKAPIRLRPCQASNDSVH